MNILHVNTFEHGGAARACIRLHQGLLQQNINSKLLFRDQSSNQIKETYAFKSLIKTRSQRLTFRFRWKFDFAQKSNKLKNLPSGFEPFQFPTSIYDITRHPQYNWADIINLHWVADFLDYPTFFTKNKKPVIWTLHDQLAFSGGYHYEKGFPFESYRDLIHKNLSIKEKALVKTDLHVIAPCQWMLEKSNKSNVFGAYNHEKIPYGINTNTFKVFDTSFSRDVLGLPKDRKILLFVADNIMNKRKGLNYLLEALPLLQDNSFALAVLGSHMPNQQQLPNIHFLGRIQDERLMALAYSAADLFVIPSVEDNLPNTVIESIACGTPVVGFRIGGIPDMILHGKNGLLCDKINSEQLGLTIKAALETSFDKQWIRKDAVKRFDQSIQAKKYIQLYKSI